MMNFALDVIDTREKAEAGVAMTLKKADDRTPILNARKEPVQLILMGSDSAAYRREQRILTKERLRISEAKMSEEDTFQAREAAEIAMLAKLTIGWPGMLDKNDKSMPFSYEGAVELYTTYPIAREQADTFIATRAHFTKVSSGA
jgi:hypothetical protein